MSDTHHEPPRGNSSVHTSKDTDAALQKELKREASEGRDAVGDSATNRNVTGSSTWETLPNTSAAKASPTAEREVKRAATVRSSADGDGDQRVHAEMIERLTRRGVHLTGRETGEQIADVLDAVERFESAVEAAGGDLMMDEPIGAGSALEPDDAAFVLPQHTSGESVTAFIERIAHATARAKTRGKEKA